MSKVIFLHLPKCGGTVVSALLNGHWGTKQYQWFGTWGEAVGNWIRQHPDWKGIGGHFWLHRYEDYITEPYKHITVLRHPVERTLSQYYYLKVATHHVLSKEANELSIEYIYTHDLGRRMQMSNLMTIYLCNNETIDLNLAKRNLREQFDLFGLQERLEEFATILRRQLSMADKEQLNYWPNASRKPLSDIPASTIRLIEENNSLDMELYSYAVDLYNEKMKPLL